MKYKKIIILDLKETLIGITSDKKGWSNPIIID